jgi:hypothetical protein
MELYKLARIRKLPNGKYRVLSEKGKDLGTYSSREQAEKRLRQIEYFKHLDKKRKKRAQQGLSEVIDLTDIEDLSFSAIMRQLRKQCEDSIVKEFLELYKKCFDRLILDEEENSGEKALAATLLLFCKQHNVVLE